MKGIIIKRKIGKLPIETVGEFPIMIENMWNDWKIFAVNIFCKSSISDIPEDILYGRGFHSRFIDNKPLHNRNTAIYKINNRVGILEDLKALAKDKLAEINFKKLDDFFIQVDKHFIVKRLE